MGGVRHFIIVRLGFKERNIIKGKEVKSMYLYVQLWFIQRANVLSCAMNVCRSVLVPMPMPMLVYSGAQIHTVIMSCPCPLCAFER